MKTLLPFLAAALALMPSAAPAQSRNSGKTHVRHIFVSVTDAKGAPVEGLSASDFNVSEGREVRLVSRAGAVAFLDALPPEDEVILVTTGRQARVRVPPTTDRKKLKETAAGLFTDGAGTVLMDGLLEIDDRFFKKADDRWPVFVIFTSDGTESGAGAREKEFMKWAVALGARGVTARAFVMKTPKGSGMPEIVAENLAQNTGGRYDVMNTTTALPAKMKALSEKLALDHRNMSAWYEVDIQTDATEFQPINVGVAREGVRLQISDRRRAQ